MGFVWENNEHYVYRIQNSTLQRTYTLRSAKTVILRNKWYTFIIALVLSFLISIHYMLLSLVVVLDNKMSL